MPVVPVYDTAKVQPAGAPNAAIQGLSPRQLAQGEINAQQTEQTGQAMQNLGVSGLDDEAKQQMLANQVRVDAALNNVRAAQQQLTYDPQTGYLAQKGQAAIQPNAQGQGLQDQYGQKLQDAISGASDGLANDAQRQVFAREAANLSTQFNGQIQGHVLQEAKSFGLSTQQGTVDLATDAARRNWLQPLDGDKPNFIDQQIESARAAVWKAGQINGTAANETAAKMQSVASGIHISDVFAALQNNRPDYAQAYLKRYGNDMDAGDLLKAQEAVKKDMDARSMVSNAQAVIGKYAPSFAPSTGDRVVQITRQSESNGNAGAVGPAIPGQGTAKGDMQVMDKTNLDPGYGVRPAADNSPAERSRVGADYILALAKNYNGDMAKAWAAYNAGPGNVDKALQDAGPQGDWMTALAKYQSAENHTQTVNYVTKNVAALNTGGGRPPMPTLQQVHQDVRDSYGPNADPHVVSGAIAEVTRQYQENVKAQQEQGEQATQQAMQYLIQTHGDINSLPPALKQQVTDLAPGKWDDLQRFAVAQANPPKADNMVAYHTAFDHPEELTNMPESKFQQFLATNFSQATQEKIQTLRDKNLKGEGALDTRTINSMMYDRLNALGVQTHALTKDAAQIGSLQQFLNDGILAQQKVLGRQMNDGEINKFINKAFTDTTTVPGILWGENVKPSLTMKKSDIPNGSLDQVTSALAKAGNMNPTDDQILRTYWAGKLKK